VKLPFSLVPSRGKSRSSWKTFNLA